MTVKLKIKKGDEVIVLTGKDKGKKGSVLKVLPSESKVIVAGINVVKKHKKPSRMDTGGIVEFEAPIHVSNVAIADPKQGKPSRVGFKVLDNGQKVRISKLSGEQIS